MRYFLILFLTTHFLSCAVSKPPQPYGALPSEGQLAWHQLERYAFLHFTTNTFTDKEWGYGDESPDVFHPTAFDADQIIGTLARTGFKGAILTAKHHDGFCLWPSKFTEHSVANSAWRNGQGDVVRAIAEACRRHGLKFGVYLSPWDRNHAGYGTPAYIDYYQNQLRELLTQYGDVFEVWFDGANGGDGYYGGARETRKIDRSTYYQWEDVHALIRELQPHAVIFSDAGPDVRWVGNEHGHAQDSCWATYTPLPGEGETRAVAGTTRYKEGETGTRQGAYWIPAEADVSIRPGWFYHPAEDDKVKSLDALLDIYFRSVGVGASLLLNVPPDRSGRIHPTDSLRLEEFHRYLSTAFADDLFVGAKAEATVERGRPYAASRVLDGNGDTYWATPDSVRTAALTITLDRPQRINCVVLQEYIPLGQRVEDFRIDVFTDGSWREVADASTIGYKRIVRFPEVMTDRVRVRVEGALACPTISRIRGYYLAP